MSAKKRGHSQADTPFDTKAVAAMTKNLPAFLQKEGYFTMQSNTSEDQNPSTNRAQTEIRADMFDHALIENREPEIKAEIKSKPLTVPEPIYRGNRLHLLFTVVGFGLVILSIWIFNARSTVSGLWADTTTKNEILNQSTTDFNSVLETIKNNDRIVREKLDANDTALDPFTEAQVQAALQEAIKPGASTKKNP